MRGRVNLPIPFCGELAEGLYSKPIDGFTKQFGWYDAFLVSLDGDILYTTARESDLAQNVASELVKGSGLEATFNKAKAEQSSTTTLYFGDFSAYKASNNEPAGFFLTQVFDEYDNLVGYAALQFPIDEISELLQVPRRVNQLSDWSG